MLVPCDSERPNLAGKEWHVSRGMFNDIQPFPRNGRMDRQDRQTVNVVVHINICML